jgi:crotonobetainyl-CoA:carnitine CoA-transferase CaiB-like acyl-CoA transferase
LAGGASADGEALEVERDDEGFGFEVIEVEVTGVGDPLRAGSVDAGVFDPGEDALFEAVAEGG